jgi:hypothetical protein
MWCGWFSKDLLDCTSMKRTEIGLLEGLSRRSSARRGCLGGGARGEPAFLEHSTDRPPLPRHRRHGTDGPFEALVNEASSPMQGTSHLDSPVGLAMQGARRADIEPLAAPSRT